MIIAIVVAVVVVVQVLDIPSEPYYPFFRTIWNFTTSYGFDRTQGGLYNI